MSADRNQGWREAALTGLVERHRTALVRMCCLCLGDASLAEDAAQETFLKALGALSVVVPMIASMFWEISSATSSLLALGAGATGAAGAAGATGATRVVGAVVVAGALAVLIRSRAWMQERI